MSYQGNNPNASRERQPSRTGSQQPHGVPTQQQPTQQPSQQTPAQWQQQQVPQPQAQQRTQIQQQPQRQPQQQTQQQPRSQTGQQVPSGTQPTPSQQQTAPTQQTQTSQQPAGLSQTMGTQQRKQQQGMQQQAMAQPQQPQAGLVQPSFQPTKVEDLIVTDVVTAQQDTPIRTVISSMAENNVGSVVVLDDDEQTPIDVVTDRKVALALEEQPDIAEQNVEEVITGDLIAGDTEMTVFEALETLSDAEIRRLPIVDADGYLQGIVTLDDLLVFLGNKLSDSLEVISAQSSR